jgi:hypothetical protein
VFAAELGGYEIEAMSNERVMRASKILAEISVGELLDKITILEIKAERITAPAKLRNIRDELAKLRRTQAETVQVPEVVASIIAELREVNAALWDIEDAIRDRELRGDFGPSFIELARSVYRMNDKRAALKRKLNEMLGSQIVEEKSYHEY